MKTNVGRKFLSIIEKNFPKGHQLAPLLNRSTLKLSYRCLPNMAALTAKHNAKVLKTANPPAQNIIKCNCRDPTTCPLPGKCQVDNIVYQAMATTIRGETRCYVGVASNFKARYYNHTSSFRHSDKRKKTKLSEFIWAHKDQNCGEM